MASVEANKLKILLQENDHVGKNTVNISQNNSTFGIPTSEDLALLVGNQMIVEKQLHEQVTFYQNALSKLKTRSEEISEENAKLYERMRESAIESTELKPESVCNENTKREFYSQTRQHSYNEENQYNLNVSNMMKMSGINTNPQIEKSYSLNDEMMQMKKLYDVKTSHLQTLLKSALKTIKQQQKEIAELRSEARLYRIPVKDGVNPGCSNCLEDLSTSQSVNDISAFATKKLKGKKKDFLESLQIQQKLLNECKKKEAEAYEQVKKSCELVEQLQLEKQEVFVQNKQLKEDLLVYQEKYNCLQKEMQQFYQNFSSKTKKEMQFHIEGLEKKNDDLSLSLNALSFKLEKVSREKTSIGHECQTIRDAFVLHKKETFTLIESLQKDVLEANKRCTLAEQELKQLHLKNKLQEKQKLKKVYYGRKLSN